MSCIDRLLLADCQIVSDKGPSLNTPVLLLTYNRPQHTEQVFRMIREAQPNKLFIAADGPKESQPDDVVLCNKVREIVTDLDWDCDLVTLFQEKNLGCRKAVSSAITWFFDNVEEGIVLEDDCVPCQSFFRFCEELLERYRDNHKIMQICGSNLLRRMNICEDSYYFSSYGPVWGWASWRRSWEHYDVEMARWPEVKQSKTHWEFSLSDEEALRREKIYDNVCSGKIDTWDYQWGFAKLINNGLSIIPRVNMVSNIGFGEQATHTNLDEMTYYVNRKKLDIDFPLKHPAEVVRQYSADRKFIDDFMLGKPEKKQCFSKISSLLRSVIGV